MHAIASVLVALLALLQIQIPAPRGLVNDFAGVLSADAVTRIEAVAQQVRDRSGGEIAVVTLRDIGDRNVGDIALQIGRDWKVGASSAVGARTRNAGVVILLVPKETSSDGRGKISIQTGQGTEGFITDAQSGDIRREATPRLQAADYSGALELITTRVAQRFAQEFGFTLESPDLALPPLPEEPQYERRGRRTGGINPVVALAVFFVVLSVLSSMGRRRRGCGGGGLHSDHHPDGRLRRASRQLGRRRLGWRRRVGRRWRRRLRWVRRRGRLQRRRLQRRMVTDIDRDSMRTTPRDPAWHR